MESYPPKNFFVWIKNQTYMQSWEIQCKIYMTTYSHIAGPMAPSGVDTEDSFVNVSINCVAVGIRDDWEAANLEEKKRNSFWRVFSEIRTNNAIACFASLISTSMNWKSLAQFPAFRSLLLFIVLQLSTSNIIFWRNSVQIITTFQSQSKSSQDNAQPWNSSFCSIKFWNFIWQ